MKVFVAGATGALGTRLVPQLVDRGHEVIGTSRSAAKAEQTRALGAEPVALDLLDRAAVRRAVLEAAPDAIVHQATALSDLNFSRNFDRTFAKTNRLRTEGTDALVAAAREAGVDRFVAQSFASFRTKREGGPVKTEDDPLDPAPPAKARESMAAMRYLEEVVTNAGGIALRYGIFYGAANDGLIEPVRSGSTQSSETAGASPHGSISTTPPRRPCSRSNTTGRASSTSSTTSPGRCASGCRCSQRRSAPSHPAAFPVASAAVRRRRCGRDGDRGAAPRTPRPSASSAGSRATPAGERVSWPPTRRPPWQSNASLIGPPRYR